MHDFDYVAPTSLQEAVSLMQQWNGAARPLAGGTDLIDHIRTGRVLPELLVDVKKIAELNRLELSDKALHVGAAVPCVELNEMPELHEQFSALADSCRIIGGIQIQNRASVGGNLCNSGPAADTIPSLIVLRASCHISGPNGSRTVPVEEFCTGPGQNVLGEGELLVELEIPRPGPRFGSHYQRFIPRNEMDIAVVGVGAAVQLDEASEQVIDARLALGAVAPKPLLVPEAADELIGKPLDADHIQAAADAAASRIEPITDMRGTVEFRKHVTGVLVRRVLTEAARRAGGVTAREG